MPLVRGRLAKPPGNDRPDNFNFFRRPNFIAGQTVQALLERALAVFRTMFQDSVNGLIDARSSIVRHLAPSLHEKRCAGPAVALEALPWAEPMGFQYGVGGAMRQSPRLDSAVHSALLRP